MLALWSTLAVSIGAVSNGSAGSGCRCGRSAETSAPTVEVAVADMPIVVGMISMGQMLIQPGHRRHDQESGPGDDGPSRRMSPSTPTLLMRATLAGLAAGTSRTRSGYAAR